jgi:CelD/BcsL family acetyltransferase involved in cellulose biosynthesis
MEALDFKRFIGRSGFATLRSEWERLAAARPRPGFQHLPGWYCAQLDTLPADDSTVEFHAVYERGTLKAIFPLRRTPLEIAGMSVRALVAPQDDHMPFADFVSAGGLADRRYLRALLRHMRREDGSRWDVLTFPRVSDGSSAYFAVGRGTPLIACIKREGTDTLPLSENDASAHALSKNFRGSLRKARNKLQAMSGVDFVSARGIAELHDAFDEFLAVEASGWKGPAGEATAIALHPQVERFYRNLIDQFGPSGSCEINLLRVGNECISAQFCIAVRDVYYVLKIGYDERHAPLAPGNMLLEHLLARLREDGRMREVNLVSDAAWHASWRPVRTPQFEIVCANNTFRGLAAIVLLRARKVARRWAPLAAAAIRQPAAAARRWVPQLRSGRVTVART